MLVTMTSWNRPLERRSMAGGLQAYKGMRWIMRNWETLMGQMVADGTRQQHLLVYRSADDYNILHHKLGLAL